MFVYKSGLLVLEAQWVYVCESMFVCLPLVHNTHTHSRCSFDHFLTKEGIQKFLYLNVAAHSPVDSFLSQPYQKEREEQRKIKKGGREKKVWFIDWENWRTWLEGEQRGSVSQWKSTAQPKNERWNGPTIAVQ